MDNFPRYLYRKFLTGLLCLFVFARLRNATNATTGAATTSNKMFMRSVYIAIFSRTSTKDPRATPMPPAKPKRSGSYRRSMAGNWGSNDRTDDRTDKARFLPH